MKRSLRREHIMFLGALCSAVLLVLTLGARAQQTGVDQEVPDNVAMHPAPEQPIPYSHRTHLALGLVCETCHANAESSALMGFPETSTCMSCHRVLPGVTWAHQPHVEAGVQCGACHGNVAQLDTMAMTTSVTSMASCISCHEGRAADTACATCHAWPME